MTDAQATEMLATLKAIERLLVYIVNNTSAHVGGGEFTGIGSIDCPEPGLARTEPGWAISINDCFVMPRVWDEASKEKYQRWHAMMVAKGYSIDPVPWAYEQK